MLKHVQQNSPNRNCSPSIKRDDISNGSRLQRIHHSSEHFAPTPQPSLNCKRQSNIDLSHHQTHSNGNDFSNSTKNRSDKLCPSNDVSFTSRSPFHPHHTKAGAQEKAAAAAAAAPPHCSCPPLSANPLRSSNMTACPLSDGCSFPSSPSSSSSSSLSSITHCSASFRRNRCGQDRKNKSLVGHRGRPPDNISLDSSMSCSSSSNQDERISSISSSAASVDNSKTTVRVWVRCLLQEMEYKTVSLSYSTTCRELVNNLLSKFRMKHRDPNLFYLAMEVTLRKAGTEVRTCLRLEDDSFPAQLLACHPQEDSRLALRMRRGGLLRVYDGALSQGSNYKSLLVSDKTPCKEVVALVLACNKVEEDPQDFTLFEICEESKTDRPLLHTEHPMLVANQWPNNWKARLEIRRLTAKERQRFSSIDKSQSKDANLNSSLYCQNVRAERCSNFSVNERNPPNFNGVKGANEHSGESLNSTLEFDGCCPSESSSHCGYSSPDSSSSSFMMETGDDPDIVGLSRNSTKLPLREGDCQSLLLGTEKRQRRKLPLPPDLVLMETVVDEDHPLTIYRRSSETPSPSKSFKTYNDYENYFYI